MQRSKRMSACLWMLLLCASCSDSTSPDRVSPPLAAEEIDRLIVFVRNWPDDYVEIDFKRQGAASTLIVYRPSQPGVPRILLDSIGPVTQDPPEIVDLLDTFNVWALADSNAAGAACSTRTGQWVCNPTVEDYSVVMLVESGGTRRAQRYTRLGESGSSTTARALGDYVLAMMRRRDGGE
jgi:hypothetical protein